MRDVKELSLKFSGKYLNTRNSLFLCSGFCLSKCLFVQLHVPQTELQEIQKNLSPFLSFQTGILTNKSHFKETWSLKYLNFPAKLQAELFDVTHTLLAPRWRRSVVEFWATLEKDFVGI